MQAADETRSERRRPLRVSEVAARLGVHRDTVHDWIKVGVRAAEGGRVRLGSRKIGGLVLVPRRALRTFLAACEFGRTSPPDTTRSESPAESARRSSAQARAKRAQAAFERRTGKR